MLMLLWESIEVLKFTENDPGMLRFRHHPFDQSDAN